MGNLARQYGIEVRAADPKLKRAAVEERRGTEAPIPGVGLKEFEALKGLVDALTGRVAALEADRERIKAAIAVLQAKDAPMLPAPKAEGDVSSSRETSRGGSRPGAGRPKKAGTK